MKAQAGAGQKGPQNLPSPRPGPRISKAVSMCG